MRVDCVEFRDRNSFEIVTVSDEGHRLSVNFYRRGQATTTMSYKTSMSLMRAIRDIIIEILTTKNVMIEKLSPDALEIQLSISTLTEKLKARVSLYERLISKWVKFAEGLDQIKFRHQKTEVINTSIVIFIRGE